MRGKLIVAAALALAITSLLTAATVAASNFLVSFLAIAVFDYTWTSIAGLIVFSLAGDVIAAIAARRRAGPQVGSGSPTS